MAKTSVEETGQPQAARLLDVAAMRVTRGGRAVLSDVSVSVEAGEIVGLLGPNGAGKSTTIGAVTGLIPFAGGTVSVLGRDGPADTANLGKLGVQPEDGGFYGWMTADAYLSYFARLYGVDEPGRQARQLLDLVRLEPDRRQPIASFSRGMRQRLGLARALVGDPQLLILDEPTNGLDPRGRRDVHDILIDLSQQGVGILMCTHILDDVERLCRSIAIISGGRTVAAGRLDQILGGTESVDRFEILLADRVTADRVRQAASPVATVESHYGNRIVLSLRPGAVPSEQWALLLKSGLPVSEIHRVGSGLEDFYLSVTEEKPLEAAA